MRAVGTGGQKADVDGGLDIDVVGKAAGEIELLHIARI